VGRSPDFAAVLLDRLRTNLARHSSAARVIQTRRDREGTLADSNLRSDGRNSAIRTRPQSISRNRPDAGSDCEHFTTTTRNQERTIETISSRSRRDARSLPTNAGSWGKSAICLRNQPKPSESSGGIYFILFVAKDADNRR
jgi:hypothetical protein